jgi:predicted N-acetyltransferase YhbS
MHATLRALAPEDLPGLYAVQLACYGQGLVESQALFARRLASPANCSLVAAREGRVCAYLAAYRSRLGKVTPLHGEFEPAETPDTLYLHDMAVLPDCAGQGLARQLLQALWAQAPGLAHAALVSVQGSQPYWQHQGFTVQKLDDPTAQRHLTGYGHDAVYMVRTLPAR